jgi:hypothetical protein
MKIKTISISIMLMLFWGQGIRGQGYIPIVETSKSWSTLNDMPDLQFSYWTKFAEDTIIGGVRYYKVIISDTVPNPGFTPNESVVGFIREDTNAQKVYFMNTSYEEGLIYDFNVNIGDTIHIDNKCYYFPGSQISSYYQVSVVVENVFIGYIIPPYENTYNNEITLSDNINRKIIVLGGLNNFFFDVWIEGIGSILGVMESGSYSSYFAPRVLLCYSNNNNTIYYNPQFSSCVFHSLNISEFTKNILIYPNPTNDYVIIENSNKNNSQINFELFDIYGARLLQANCSDNTSRIDLNGLKSGIYLIRLINVPFNAPSYKLIIK